MSELSTVRIIRCIVCPTGCEIKVMENLNKEIIFEGYACKRGKEYAEQEYYEPKRILTTTIRVESGFLPLVPVRTDKSILRDKLSEVMKIIAETTIKAPIKMGDILIKNVLDTGANVIASRDLAEV